MRDSLGRGNIWGEEGAGGDRMDLMRGMEKQVSDARIMAISNFAVDAGDAAKQTGWERTA